MGHVTRNRKGTTLWNLVLKSSWILLSKGGSLILRSPRVVARASALVLCTGAKLMHKGGPGCYARVLDVSAAMEAPMLRAQGTLHLTQEQDPSGV